jgi:hypothetical protein
MTQINFVSGNEDVPINITINAYWY